MNKKKEVILAFLSLFSISAGFRSFDSNVSLPTYKLHLASQSKVDLIRVFGGLSTIDINGDGFLDIVDTPYDYDPATNTSVPQKLRVFVNDKKGHLRLSSEAVFDGPVPLLVNARHVIADFNSDGRPDIFFADFGMDADPFPGFKNTLILSKGKKKMIDASTQMPQIVDNTHNACAGDVDGDGDYDLFVEEVGGGPGPRAPYFLINDGAGHFTVGDSIEKTYQSCMFVDVNRDGSSDLVAGGNPPIPASNGTTTVFLNDGQGHFTELLNAIPPGPFGVLEEFTDAIASQDVNRDGYEDLLLADHHDRFQGTEGVVRILINRKNGTFQEKTKLRMPKPIITNRVPTLIRPLDIDGDRNVDLLVDGGQFPQFILSFLNKGRGKFSFIKEFPNDSSNPKVNGGNPLRVHPEDYVPYDLDGDGNRDFYFREWPEETTEWRLVAKDTSPARIPNTPSQVQATRGLPTKIVLSWLYAWGAINYEVWRSTSPDSTGTLVATVKRQTWFTDTTAPQGKNSYYSIRSLNPAGTSTFSNPVIGFRP